MKRLSALILGRFVIAAVSAAALAFALSITGATTARAAPASFPAAGTGLVAAYAFNEGSGTTVTDVSGNANNGTVSNATWATAGKYGGALSFNGTSSRVTMPDSASLQPDDRDDARGLGQPDHVTSAWRDVIYKGDDNYYLRRPDQRWPGRGGSSAAPTATSTARARSRKHAGRTWRSPTTGRRSGST